MLFFTFLCAQHHLRPLDVGPFSQLQSQYRKTVGDYCLTTNIRINRYLFVPIYKQV